MSESLIKDLLTPPSGYRASMIYGEYTYPTYHGINPMLSSLGAFRSPRMPPVDLTTGEPRMWPFIELAAAEATEEPLNG